MIPASIADLQQNLPIDLQAVAARLGLRIISSRELPSNVSGLLLKDPSFGTESGFVIMVNAKEPARRQRFTAAHEIGHFVLHKDSIGDRLEDSYLLRSPGMSNRQEVEANRFAADLLMPMSKVVEQMNAGLDTTKQLANAFGVSEIAMGIRLGLPT